MNNKLTELTDIVINEVMKKEIVLPSTYKEHFDKKAKELDLDLDKEEELLTKAAEVELSKANTLMQSTRDNVNKLEAFTQSASEAIKAHDTEALDNIAHDVNSLKKEIQRLHMSVYMDPLTKTYNRTWISEQFLDGESFASDGVLAFFDLNKFKIINDTYGHIVGDKVLIFFANFLKQKFKAAKIIRYGGDEFIMLLNVDVETLKKHLKKSRQDLEAKKLKAPNSDALFVSFSYGVVSYSEGDIFRDALELADTLMYEQKNSGR